MTDCEKCQQLLPFYRDDALSAGESAFVADHLDQCAACRAQLAQYDQLDQLLDLWTAEEIAPPENFHADLMMRLQQEKSKIIPISQHQWWLKRNLPKLMSAALTAALLLLFLPTVLQATKDNALQQLPAPAAQQAPPMTAAADSAEQALPQPANDSAPKTSLESRTQTSAPDDAAPPPPTDSLPPQVAADGQGAAETAPPSLRLQTPETATAEESTPRTALFSVPPSDELPSEAYDWPALAKQADETLALLQMQQETLAQNPDHLAPEALAQAQATLAAEIARQEKLIAAIEAQDSQAYEAILAQ